MLNRIDLKRFVFFMCEGEFHNDSFSLKEASFSAIAASVANRGLAPMALKEIVLQDLYEVID